MPGYWCSVIILVTHACILYQLNHHHLPQLAQPSTTVAAAVMPSEPFWLQGEPSVLVSIPPLAKHLAYADSATCHSN